MHIKKSIYFIGSVLLVFIVFLSGCSTSFQPATYKGPMLHIASIGAIPKWDEKNVMFSEINFDELTVNELSYFDAVVIGKSALREASKKEYSQLFSQSNIPVFFLGASELIPFIDSQKRYDNTWKWQPGSGYALGTVTQENSDEHRTWDLGLHKDELTEKTLKDVYARMFLTVASYKREQNY